MRARALELGKLLLGTGQLAHLEHVEAHRLGQGPALADGHDVSDFDVPVGKIEEKQEML